MLYANSWLMELPQVCDVADVITTWQMLWPKDGMLADVIANVAGVMATGSCLLQFKFCDVVQNLIPYLRQMVFAYVLV